MFSQLGLCTWLFSDILTSMSACTLPMNFMSLSPLSSTFKVWNVIATKVFSPVVYILSSSVPSNLLISYHHLFSHIFYKLILFQVDISSLGLSKWLLTISFYPWWNKISGYKVINLWQVPGQLSWSNLYKEKKARVLHPDSCILWIKIKKSTLP